MGKPKVIIDLDEYNALLAKKSFQDYIGDAFTPPFTEKDVEERLSNMGTTLSYRNEYWDIKLILVKRTANG